MPVDKHVLLRRAQMLQVVAVIDLVSGAFQGLSNGSIAPANEDFSK